jgi:hypothetical protein
MASSLEPSVPVGQDTVPHWAPRGPLFMSLFAVVAAAVGAVIFGRSGGGQTIGALVYILAVLLLVRSSGRAITARNNYFAKFGVPRQWTNPPLIGLKDIELRRWDNTIRDMRAPLPAEQGMLLIAARARAEGLTAILLPASLAPLLSVVGGLLLVRGSPHPALGAAALLVGLCSLILGVMAAHSAVNGRHARAYLARFSTPAVAGPPSPN